MPKGKRNTRKEELGRPLRELVNAPTSAHSVPVLVAAEFPTEVSDRETIVQKATDTITNIMHTVDVHEVQGQQAVTNPRGLSLFESLGRLETDLRATQSELRVTQSDLRATQSELAVIKSEFKPIKSLLYDAREREYVTHLRDFCDDYGIPRHSRIKKSILQREVSSRVEALNSGIPSILSFQFRKIYGLNADQIKELSAHDYASLLQILDAVGTSRYQGQTMKEEEESLFKEMIELIDARNFDRAEEAAKSAIEGNKFYRPFVPWPAELGDVEEDEG